QKLAAEPIPRVQKIYAREEARDGDAGAEEDVFDLDRVKSGPEALVHLFDGPFEHRIEDRSSRQRAVNPPRLRFAEFAAQPHLFDLLHPLRVRVEELPRHSHAVFDLWILVVFRRASAHDSIM